MRNTLRRVLTTCLALTVGLGAASCTSHELDTVDAPAPERERFALVTLTYSEAEDVDRLVAQAYFVEHQIQPREPVLQMLGVPRGAWVDPALPLDACTVETRPLRPPRDDVRLLDAGELLVDLPDRTGLLDSYYFPSVYPSVDGLAYDGVVEGSRAFRAADALAVLADGSDEVGGFSVSLAPPPVVTLRSALGDRPWSDGLDVRWDRRGSTQDDLTLVALTRRGFDAVATVTCAVEDDGHFQIPAAALMALPELGDDQIDHLAIQRVRAVSFTAPGMPDGLVLAIAEDAVHLE